jgi:hypothetical protein
LPVSGHAQQLRFPISDSRFPVADSGSSLTVTLLTYDTGEKVWERFGHNALWIHDARTGGNEHYDYGRFDFGQPNFVLRFLQGRMWYSMGYESNVAGMLDLYASQGRRIWAQELDLAPAEKLALRRFLAWNIQPENAPHRLGNDLARGDPEAQPAQCLALHGPAAAARAAGGSRDDPVGADLSPGTAARARQLGPSPGARRYGSSAR